MNKGKQIADTLYTPSIDSFKWRIELDKVDVLNRNLLDHIINSKVNTTTGEVIEEIPIQSNSLKIQFNKYHIHFGINKIFGVEYLVVLINSKLLENEYMQGISMYNIEKIYNKIMSCKIFDITFECFMSQGKISDVDVKKDIEITKQDFKDVIRILEKKTKPSSKRSYGANSFISDSNMGIEWNSRERATFAHPFLKFYHKGIEALCSKNKEFFSQYIDVSQLKDVVRVETTIKSFKELQKHGFSNNTLLDLMKADVHTLNEITKHSVISNLEPRVKRADKTSTSISPTDMLIYIHLSNMIQNQGMTFESSLEYTLDHYTDKHQKKRIKTKITEIYDLHVRSQKYEQKISRQDKFFNLIGWG